MHLGNYTQSGISPHSKRAYQSNRSENEKSVRQKPHAEKRMALAATQVPTTPKKYAETKPAFLP